MTYFLRTTCIAFTISICSTAYSQEVVSPIGKTDTTVNTQVTWNLGEVVTSTGTAGSIESTQGYVQPIFSIVSIEEKNTIDGLNLSLFPNPASQEVNLVLDGNLDGETLIKISNISGQVIREETFLNNKHTLQIDEMAPATYFIEVISMNGSYYNKLKLVKTQ